MAKSSNDGSSYDELLLKELRKQFPSLSDKYLAENGESLLLELRRRKESGEPKGIEQIPNTLPGELFENKPVKRTRTSKKPAPQPPADDTQPRELSLKDVTNKQKILIMLASAAQYIDSQEPDEDGRPDSLESAALVLNHTCGAAPTVMFTLPANLVSALGALMLYSQHALNGQISAADYNGPALPPASDEPDE